MAKMVVNVRLAREVKFSITNEGDIGQHGGR